MSNLEHPSTPILCPLAKKFEVTQPVGDIGSWTWLVTVKPPNRIYSQWFCWDFPGLAPVFILDAYWFSDTRRASFIRAKVCQSIERGTYFNFDLHGSMRYILFCGIRHLRWKNMLAKLSGTSCLVGIKQDLDKWHKGDSTFRFDVFASSFGPCSQSTASSDTQTT